MTAKTQAPPGSWAYCISVVRQPRGGSTISRMRGNRRLVEMTTPRRTTRDLAVMVGNGGIGAHAGGGTRGRHHLRQSGQGDDAGEQGSQNCSAHGGKSFVRLQRKCRLVAVAAISGQPCDVSFQLGQGGPVTIGGRCAKAGCACPGPPRGRFPAHRRPARRCSRPSPAGRCPGSSPHQPVQAPRWIAPR